VLPRIVTWRNWDRLYTDVSLWRGPIERVFSRLGLSLVSIDAGFPGTSAAFAVECAPGSAQGGPTDSHESAFAVGGGKVPPGRYVVKFYPPMVHGDFVAEVEVRGALRTARPGSLSPVPGASPVPDVVAAGILEDRIDWPYLVEPFLPGRAVREVWDGMDAAGRAGVAVQVADLLKAVHSTPLSLLPRLTRTAREWQAWAHGRLDACVDEIAAAKILPDAILPEIRRFMDEEGGRVIAGVEDGSLNLLHGDMTEDHVLVEQVETQAGRKESVWQVTGLIDFGDAEVGPLFYEWVALWFALFRQDATAFRAFLERYEGSVPDVAAGRAMVFTLLHRFNSAIIAHILRRRSVDPSGVADLAALVDLMWPHL
jgi:hygromycin-B 7''-O-kinase